MVRITTRGACSTAQSSCSFGCHLIFFLTYLHLCARIFMAVPVCFAGADREAAPLGDRPSSGPWGHGALAWAVGTRGCTGILCWGSCPRTLALLRQPFGSTALKPQKFFLPSPPLQRARFDASVPWWLEAHRTSRLDLFVAVLLPLCSLAALWEAGHLPVRGFFENLISESCSTCQSLRFFLLPLVQAVTPVGKVCIWVVQCDL